MSAPTVTPLRLIVEPGATARLPELVRDWNRIVVFGTDRALAESRMTDLLAGHEVATFTAITPNPTVATVLAAAEVVAACQPDVIVAVGGGSTLDVAKAARVLPPSRDAALAALTGDDSALLADPPKLVLLPTTSGSGAEVTRFATVYLDGRKHSLDFPQVRADIAVVDPERSHTCPPDVTAACAFDALAHSVESLWSTRSTPESRRLADSALRELADLTDQPLDRPTRRQRHRLAIAATTAGQAIDISRTAAAHAFSYWLTGNRGVPHGLACAVNLVWLLRYNGRHAEPGDTLSAVHRRLAGTDDADAAAGRMAHKLTLAGASARLRDYGLSRVDLAEFVDAGLGTPSRADNNPVTLDRQAVLAEVVRHY